MFSQIVLILLRPHIVFLSEILFLHILNLIPRIGIALPTESFPSHYVFFFLWQASFLASLWICIRVTNGKTMTLHSDQPTKLLLLLIVMLVRWSV